MEDDYVAMVTIQMVRHDAKKLLEFVEGYGDEGDVLLIESIKRGIEASRQTQPEPSSVADAARHNND